jgi:hypothetical protein
LKINQRFGACFTLVSCSAYSLTPETSIDFQRTTRRHIPGDRTLNNHRSENVKLYLMLEKILVDEDASAISKLCFTNMKYQSFHVSWVIGYFLTLYQMQMLFSTVHLYANLLI